MKRNSPAVTAVIVLVAAMPFAYIGGLRDWLDVNPPSEKPSADAQRVIDGLQQPGWDNHPSYGALMHKQAKIGIVAGGFFSKTKVVYSADDNYSLYFSSFDNGIGCSAELVEIEFSKADRRLIKAAFDAKVADIKEAGRQNAERAKRERVSRLFPKPAEVTAAAGHEATRVIHHTPFAYGR